MTGHNSLEMLCYCLNQAVCAEASILFEVNDNDAALYQAKQFANEINNFINSFHLTENQLDKVYWYDAALVNLVLGVEIWDDLKNLRNVQLEEDFDDALSNRPCDNYGMLACSSSCPDWNKGCRR